VVADPDAPVVYSPNANELIEWLCASRGFECSECMVKVGLDHGQSFLELTLTDFDETSNHSNGGRVTRVQGSVSFAKFMNSGGHKSLLLAISEVSELVFNVQRLCDITKLTQVSGFILAAELKVLTIMTGVGPQSS